MRYPKLIFCGLLLLAGHAALGTPVVCSLGYGDSTCVPALQASAEPQPQCSNAAGWTTSAPAAWEGSHWSQPICTYQAPQSCPTGTLQLSAATWNGTSWVGPTCQAAAPTTPADEKNACATALGVSAGSMVGPLTGTGLDQFDSVISYYSDMGWIAGGPVMPSGTPGSPATNDMFYQSGDPVTAFCWVQPGSTTVTGAEGYGWCSPNGGAASCGGGGVGN